MQEWADERAEARFRENQQLQRTLRATQKMLAEREQEAAILRKRIANYEHPSLGHVEKLLEHTSALSREAIAARLDLSTEEAEAVLQEMAQRGYNVEGGVVSKQPSGRRVVTEHFHGPEVRFGLLSDTHLGNHHALEDQLHEAYEIFRQEEITTVYTCGNLLDGEKTYRGQEYEIKVMGADNCADYLARTWPKVPGITTYHIASSSCHEGYYLKSAGLLIGRMIENRRPDMVYLGLDEADVVLHDSEARPTLRLIHPGGGSSYADSYRPQKIVESYHGGEKPTMLAIGHYHKAGVYDIRDVLVLQAGCLERQTPFMRKQALMAKLGFWVVEVKFTEHGSLRRVRTEWFKYYVGSDGQVLRDWS